MATTKTLGIVPVSRGEYVSGTTYYKYNLVKRYGSVFIYTGGTSTTTAPCTLSDDEITANTGWEFFADASAAYFVDKNEEARKTAEAARVKAEESRVSAESSRASAESSRVSAESSRASAETKRATAESSRVSAESARVTAESKRATDTATAISNANEAATAANEAAEKANSADLTVLNDYMEQIIRDLALYEEGTPITLKAGTAGKYVDIYGNVQTNSSYTISSLVDVEKGKIYLVKSSTDLITGLALAATYTTGSKDVAIEYAETYDSDGNVLTATADYDSTLVYTYNYDTDSEGNKTFKNITDKSGNVVDYLPMYRTVGANSYLPLFKSLNSNKPISGYYGVVALESGKAVFSIPSADFPAEVKIAQIGIINSLINNKEDKAVVKKLQQQVTELQTELSTMSEQSLAVGFARINGSADPAADEDDCFGKKSYIHDIGSHLHLGIVKDGVVTRTAKAGRLTLGTDDEPIAIDGSEGDVMLFFDCPTELLKANEDVNGVNTNVIGLSLAKSAWQGHVSKTLDCYAITPDETVNCKLDGDARSQAHSVYNTSAIGTYTAKSAMFSETYRASGAGIPSHYVSGVSAIQQAQNKNTDALTNRPYMGFYYEFYEAILALMFAECKTVYVNAPTLFGCGCTSSNKTNASTFYDEAITGNSGVKWLDADGNAAFTNIFDQVLVGTTKTYCLDGLVGSAHYTCEEMLEPQRVLDAIAAAGLVDNIGNSSAIFYFNDEGTMEVSTDGSIDPATGTGMTAAKKYYVVRNVPNCEGMADGVMTAVINVYTLMNVDSANTVTISTTNTTARTKAIFKFSFPIYRGFTLPLCGAFRQLQGAHYLYGKDADGNVIHKFLCASNVDNIPAATTFVKGDYYNTIDTTLNFARGLDIIADREGISSSWMKSANYGNSIFDATANGGSLSSHESMYKWLKSCYGVGVSNQPENGYWSLNASAAGCNAIYGLGSVRTADCSDALSHGHDSFAGAFAIPHVQFATTTTTATA